MTKVFLSYARSDASEFTEELRRELESNNIPVWWDESSMQSRGRGFLQEIRTAIEQCDRLIAVVSPAAHKSEYVRDEWVHAIRCGRVVLPIITAGFDSGALTDELMPFHSLTSLESERLDPGGLRELLRLLRTPVEPLGPLLTSVPGRPSVYEVRPSLDSRIRESVLSGLRTPLSGLPATTALRGMGGAGKTVAAAAFCASGETRRAFPNGIIWVPCGPHPTAHAPLRMVARALGLAREAQTVTSVRDVLADRCCLIVLDDLWEQGTLALVQEVLGPSCRLLTTTRVIRVPGASEIEVGELSEDEARRLLATWSRVPQDALPPAAHDVATESGHLALALALCGAMNRDGIGWEELKGALRAADLAFLPIHFPEYREYDSLLRSIRVSFDVMSRRRPDLENRCRELVVFSPGETIPEFVVARLWRQTAGLSPRQTRDTLHQLESRSIVRIQRNEAGHSLTLHDLHHDFLRVTVSNAPQFHRMLLDAYQPPSGRWAESEDRDYILRRLPRHLVGAGCAEEIHTLLSREDHGANHWCDGLESTGGLDIAADTLRDARRTLRDDTESISIVRTAQYAMMLASIRTGASRVPARMIIAGVRCGALPLERGLVNARLSAYPQEGIDALTTLLLRSDAQTRRELLALYDSLTSEHERCAALSRMVEFFARTRDGAGLAAALERAARLDSARGKTAVISAAAPVAPEDEVDLLIQFAEEISQSEPHSLLDGDPAVMSLFALADIAPRLPSTQRKAILLRIEHAIRRGHWTLISALGNFEPSEYESVLERIGQDVDEHALPDLALISTGETRRSLVLRAARHLFQRFTTGDLEELANWFARLDYEERKLAWNALPEVGFTYSRTMVMARLVPLLPAEDRLVAAEQAWNGASDWLLRNGSVEQIEIADALAYAAPSLSDEHRERLIRVADGIQPSSTFRSSAADRCRILLRLSDTLDEPRRTELVDLAFDRLTYVSPTRDDTHRLVHDLAGRIDGARWDRLQHWMRRAGDEPDLIGSWLPAWSTLTHFQRAWLGDRLFAQIEAIDERSTRRAAFERTCDALASISPQRCLEIARSIDRPERITALARLAAALPQSSFADLGLPSFEELFELPDLELRLETFAALMPRLTGPEAQIVRRNVAGWLGEVEYPRRRAERLVELLPSLSHEESTVALSECVRSALDDERDSRAVSACEVLIGHVDGRIARAMLTEVDESWSDELPALRIPLAVRLAELGAIGPLMDLFESQDWSSSRIGEIFPMLAPKLSKPQLDHAIARAEAELRPYQREQALAALLPCRFDAQYVLDRVAAFETPFFVGRAIATTISQCDALRDRSLIAHAIRITETINSPSYRQVVYEEASTLVSRRREFSREAAAHLLHEVLDQTSEGERVHLCRALVSWSPVIVKLGGETTWQAIFDRFTEVVRWWPT